MTRERALLKAAERWSEMDGWSGTQNGLFVDGIDYEWAIEIAKDYLRLRDLERPLVVAEACTDVRTR